MTETIDEALLKDQRQNRLLGEAAEVLNDPDATTAQRAELASDIRTELAGQTVGGTRIKGKTWFIDPPGTNIITARRDFLTGEGTLTLRQIVDWALEHGHPAHMVDFTEIPADHKMMVSVVPPEASA